MNLTLFNKLPKTVTLKSYLILIKNDVSTKFDKKQVFEIFFKFY